jgi:hypothetical protein
MVSQQSIGDVNAYVVMAGMTQVYASIKDKNFVLATGKPMFEKALAGDVSSGFTAKMEDKDLAEKLKAEESIFYLNIDETMKLVGNFEMFLQGFTGGQGIDQKTQDTVGKFEYVLATNKLDGNSIVGELVIKTKFAEPFFIEVANLAKSFESQ